MGIISTLFASKGVNIKSFVDDGAIIVDVRSPQEFASGHINGSRNIPLDTLPAKAAALHGEGKVVITCCRSGTRSGIAQGILKSKGIQAYNGGAWDSLNQKIK